MAPANMLCAGTGDGTIATIQHVYIGTMHRPISRRTLLTTGLGGLCTLPFPVKAVAQSARLTFPQWVDWFRARALARGISAATYSRVMSAIAPDTSVYALDRAQPEFQEVVWQYLNRRVSDWRISTGKERAREHAKLLERIEREYGIDRYVMLGLWGMESAFGDVVENPKHMRPVLPALAALAWGEPRRQSYWEKELLNALVIVERGWGAPTSMIGSWAGAMGHTQWMPEVWLNMGVDFNGDGRISPFGPPDDSLAGTARFLQQRGQYRRGEIWGCEVRLPAGVKVQSGGARSMSGWSGLGVTRADGRPLPPSQISARLWQPAPGGPVLLITRNFDAVKSYNPANTYALAIVHLGDRIRGDGPFVQPFPGGERIPTVAEIQEIQRRLTSQGFDTGGTDGRVGRDTMLAIRAYQRKVGLQPADGYAGLKLLARLRQGG
jgi:membrane-bound lytic murein transglycosylase B